MTGMPITDTQLKEVLTREHFQQILSEFRQTSDLPLTVCGIHGTELRGLQSSPHLPAFCQRIRRSKVAAARCRRFRQISLAAALQTGQPYLSLCHAGIFAVCVPIADGSTPLGGVLIGKCLCRRFNRQLETDVQTRLAGLHIYPHEILEGLIELPVVGARQLLETATTLQTRLCDIAGLQIPSRPILPKIAQAPPGDLSISLERQIIAAIQSGDLKTAAAKFDELLKPLRPDTPEQAKTGLIESCAALIRAAGNADITPASLQIKLIDAIHTTLPIQNTEEMVHWFRNVKTDFITAIQQAQNKEKRDHLQPAIDLMRYNCAEPLTVPAIALAASLSVSRLEHLFTEQMGMTVIDYLNTLRIDHAKRLLTTTDTNCTNIAYTIGFSSPAYFTRVFKKHTGQTPNQYRDKR